MILRICAGLVLLLTGFVSSAQTKVTINGYVKDSASGESIIGASITVDGKAVGSNQYGFYSITLDTGEYDLSVSHVSYLTYSQRIILNKNVEQNLYLLPKSAALSEVIVYSKRRDANVRNAQMGQFDLSINQVKKHSRFYGRGRYLKSHSTLARCS